MKTYKSMLLLTAITLLAMSPVVSYAQYTMLVHKTDGNILRLSVADVDSVTFDYSSIQTVTHEYIDLGLSVMWATCNVGASSPLMSGDYYAWGEKETHYVSDFQSGGVEWKEGKTGYDWTSYYYRIAESEWNTVTVSKYNSDASRGNVDNKTSLDMGDDVAYVKWGRDWRMPTYEEFEELIKSCTWIRSNHNGIDGYTVRSNLNGDSIFFPYSGEFIWDINVPDNATEVMCWTRTVGNAGTGYAYYMTTDNGKASMAYNQRCFGLTVRPVFVSDKYDSTKVAYIVLGNAELQLNTGASEGISCYTYSSLGNSLTADVNWSSTDPSVATVSNDGTVTAVKAGTCKVVASIGSISRMCDVIVTTQVLPSSASGSNNGYGYVDLGLSVKWAICNIGADNPEDYGDYFAWGETEPYYADSYSQSNNPVWKDGKSNGYSWSSYKYANGSNGALTKYCTDSSKGYNGFVDNKTVLDLEDDAAHVNWGGNWRMPTQEEMEELRGKCSWSWTTLNGVVGYLVTSQVAGYENSSIFFPAAGSRSGTYLSGVGTKGKYWSNTFGRYYSDESIYGCNFEMSSGFSYSHSNYGTIRYYGMSIRPVCVKRLEQLYDLTLSESSLQLHVGGTRELLADTSGIGPVELAWSSTNDSVATVRGGVVTAIGAGTCEIILTAGDHQGICDVTVYENTDHEYVDLGLSVLWATCNVGASSPEGYGEYYSWGELEPKSSYYNNTYKFITGAQQHSGGTYTKYCNSDGKTVLEPEDDVAQIKWGGGWRIPSPDECSELLNNCTWTWTSLNGINGCLIVSKINGKSIFLPASGSKWYDDPTATSLGSSGSYHTNKVYTSESTRYVMCFSSPGTDARVSYGSRYPGSSVRPVISPSDTVKQVGPPANEIWYTSTDGKIVALTNTNCFGANVISNTYENGKGIILFDGDVVKLGDENTNSSGASPFNYSRNLRTIELPESVRKIGYCTFFGCGNLISIKLPSHLDFLGGSIAESAPITELYIPETEVFSSLSVASNNRSLAKFTGPYASSDGRCLIKDKKLISFAPAGLDSYDIPYGVETVGNYSFSSCSDLKSITIPSSVKTLESDCFSACSALSSIEIPNSVTSIGSYAFAYCRNLKSIHIPENAEVGDYGPFSDCDSLAEFTGRYASADGRFLIKDKTLIAFAYAGVTECVVPEGVEKMTRFVFDKVIKSVTIASTVSKIHVLGGDSIKTIICKSVLPPDVDYFWCKNFDSICVPAESVGAYKAAKIWSDYADRIKAINGQQQANDQPSNEIWYTSTDGAVVAPYDASVFGATLLSNTYQDGKGVMTFSAPVLQIGRYAFKGRNKLETIKIPSSVTSFMWCCFEDCSSLSSVNIPDNVTEVDVASFMDCSSLTSIVLPDKVRGLDNQIFSNCGKLSSIQFSDSITYIAHWVFEGTAITTLVIPATVSYIDWGSIAGCRNLTSVSVDPQNTYYDSRGNSNAIIHTATNTLISGCATTVIPQDVTALYDYAFTSCAGLDTITIPEGVNTIGRQVFQGCSNLSSITIPSTVQTMGQSVFNACQNLSYVKVLATVPPTIGETVFSTYNNCPIYVPAESLQAYKSAENWSVYADRIQAIP